jgi:hypothetical protein
MIQRSNLYPDIVTFGVLALGCQTKQEAHCLLTDMREAGFRYDIHKMCKIISETSMHIQKYACKYMCVAQMAVQNLLSSTSMEGSHHLVMLFSVCFEEVMFALISVGY